MLRMKILAIVMMASILLGGCGAANAPNVNTATATTETPATEAATATATTEAPATEATETVTTTTYNGGVVQLTVKVNEYDIYFVDQEKHIAGTGEMPLFRSSETEFEALPAKWQGAIIAASF